MRNWNETQTAKLLRKTRNGDAAAGADLVPVVYPALRRLAARYLRGERPDHTLQATALVHEVYLRLVDAAAVEWQDRAHFLGITARLMRQILVEHARGRAAAKRGGGRIQIPLDDGVAFSQAKHLDALALEEVLSSLEATDERRGRVVELRIFGGLTFKETAEVLGVSPKTVEADWYLARAWLRVELRDRGFLADEV